MTDLVMPLVAGLSSVGLLIATYFTAVVYRWVPPDPRWMPAFCRMDEQTCSTIVFTPQARVFGLPNSVLGQLFYVSLILGVTFGWVGGSTPVATMYLVVSTVTVGLGVYLSYALLFTLRVPCPLCFTSHAINAVILVLLLVAS